MNKQQGKGIGLKEQFGIESTASDFIDRKLLEEKRHELKMLINFRFGPTAWDTIISERATRIAGAKEKARLAKIEARQKQKELIDTIQTVAIVLCVCSVIIIGFFVTFKVMADGYKYVPKSYTKKQLEHQGKIKKPKYTTCRLAKRVKAKNGQQACVYVGGNKTYELVMESFCPPKYKCRYNPHQTEQNIDDIIDSLNSIGKK